MSAGWDRVVAGAGAAAVVILWAVAAIARDIEAFAIGLLLGASVLGLSLSAPRWARAAARLGVVILLLDVAVWMGPAVVSNTAAGEAVGDVLTPMALTSAAVLGLLASAARRLGPSATRQRVGALVSAVVLSGVVTGVLSIALRGNGVAARPGDVVISARNVEFSTGALASGQGPQAVVVTNHDLFWHTFTIEELGVDLRVPTGGTRRAVFDARPGVYEYVCAIPGHETRMRGTLTVS